MRYFPAQFFDVSGLVHTVVRTESKRVAHHLPSAGRDADDRNVGRHSAPFALNEECQAVHHWHHEIDEDDARAVSFQRP